ncbi:MAG: Crp/Fnr family transcriptional regulator [Bacteroidetes bacterium]|nr:Crp/Fnr family transcriptional regulator [Bacteroidota bacterium]MBK9402684.1 Crp/Fnr family transcriptional regulator [Bacteroidota bacterium]
MRKKTINMDCFNCESRLHSVFCKISDNDVLNVNLNKNRFVYNKGDILFHRDTLPLGIFIIEKGKVKIYKYAGNGRDQIVRLTKPGDIIGYRALLNSRPYSSTAEAIEETVVCFLSKDLFMDIMKNNNSVNENILKLMTKELDHTETLLCENHFKSVRARVADMILYIKEKYGFEKDNITINITLSRSDLSSLVGTATETLIRTLITLKEEQIIDFSGKRIQIKDQKKLIQAAQRKES